MDVISRGVWGSVGSYVKQMQLPAIGVHIHHSVTYVSNDPMKDARTIEGIGIDRFGRGSYSYLFHPNGTVLELAGEQVGAHTVSENGQGEVTRNWNPDTFGCCFIGNYTVMQPTSEQISAFGAWFRDKVNAGKLVNDGFIVPHYMRKATACPGSVGNYLNELRAATQNEDLMGSAEEIHEIWAMMTSNGAYRPPVHHLGEAILATSDFARVQIPRMIEAFEAREDVDDAVVLNAVAETNRQLLVVVSELKTAMLDVLTQPIRDIVTEAVTTSLSDTVQRIIEESLSNIRIEGRLVSGDES